MKRKNILQFVRQTMRRPMMPSALCILALLMAACTQDEPADGTALPEGKYPMTFSTAVEGLTVSRANTAEGEWTEGDAVAVKVGNDVKQYTPATGSTPVTLQAASNVTPFYWQKSDETKKVSAWYCGTEYKETLPATWAVQSNQSTENGKGYQQSDFLYAPETTISFAERNNASLTFYHQTAKVIINIVNGEAATNVNQIQSVVIGNNNIALSGTYTKPNTGQTAGTWNTSSATMSTITPKSITPASGCLKSYAALVIPQDVTDKFIAVTLNNSNTYYYTPENNDGNLQAGQQHTYNITVKGTKLEVTTETPVSWTDEELQSSDTPTEVTSFRVTLSGSNLPTLASLNNITNESDNVYKTTGNSFSFTIPKNGRNGFLIQKGLADVAQKEEDGNVIYTCTNVRSDLALKYGDCPQVGDYYYSDGTWSSTYTPGTSPACIGVVFKVGAGTGDYRSNYYGKLSSILGYVAALQNANGGNKLAWSTEKINTGVSTSQTNFDGYSNTQIITNISGYKTKYPAFESCINNNGTAAPSSSSGWYMPSLAQIKALYDISNSISSNFTTANGAVLSSSSDYWASNEYDADYVWHFNTGGGGSLWHDTEKTVSTKDYVRAILTF
ncbi:fimbrillin family protein [Parabacteroides pacaensis]|uniref:fimbrillin family protein n=1 Tax=Parabacteroides pacaensis TaxID=2086575 RepID=UPI00131C5DD9|nr:fimbrillin family protein [Parabacteroides pacaensis]